MAQMQVHKEPSELSFKNNTCLPKASGTADTSSTDYASGSSTDYASGRCEKTLHGIIARYTSPDVPDKNNRCTDHDDSFTVWVNRVVGKIKGTLREGLATCR